MPGGRWGKLKQEDGTFREMTDAEKKERYGTVEPPPRRPNKPRISAPQPEVEASGETIGLEDLPDDLKIPLAMAPITIADLGCYLLTGPVFKLDPPFTFALHVDKKGMKTVAAAFDKWARTLKVRTTPFGAWMAACATVSSGAILASLHLRSEEKFNRARSANGETTYHPGASGPGSGPGPVAEPARPERSATIDESSHGPPPGEGFASSATPQEVPPEPAGADGGPERVRENDALELVSDAEGTAGLDARPVS